ncbi:MAG: metal transporter, partial [Mesorhizobium sp.]
VLDTSGLHLLVRAGGSEPMTIAQVQVDGAYWQFTQDPPGTIARASTAWINLPFPWVLGETHTVNLVTNSGVT